MIGESEFCIIFASEKFDFDMVSRVINEEYPDVAVVGGFQQEK